MSLPDFETLDAILRHYARAMPDAEIAIEGTRRLSYRAADHWVDRLCAWLERHAVKPGDRVALLAPPGLSYLLVMMATARLGAIYVGVNPRYTIGEIEHALSTTNPALFLYEPSAQDSDLVTRISAAAGLVPVLAMPALDALPDIFEPRISPAGRGDVAVIVFTSGSTGRPKGAALHHGGLLASSVAQHDHFDGEPRRYLSNLPINHVGAIMNVTLGCLVGGGALVFQGKFDPAGVLDLIERERIETWLQVPAMFTLVVNHPDFGKRDLSSLKTIAIGGGAPSAPTLAKLRTTGAAIFVEYGQTEVMSTIAYADAGASDEALLTTIGRFDSRFETRIADEAGRTCVIGEVGEIQARGDCVLRGYWANEEATRAAFTADGWLRTGDLAVQNPDGTVSLKGRLREMIKSGGYNVYPREVEIVIETFPGVAEVVVYGVTDPIYGEAVHCAIEGRLGETVSIEALKAHCANALANYKIPKIFRLVNLLPRLGNGKIDRASVRNV